MLAVHLSVTLLMRNDFISFTERTYNAINVNNNNNKTKSYSGKVNVALQKKFKNMKKSLLTIYKIKKINIFICCCCCLLLCSH